MPDEQWLQVAQREHLTADNPLEILLDENWPVLIMDIDGQLFAVDALCTHEVVSLRGGEIDRPTHEIICPLHGARFNIQTGAATRGPAAAPLTVYPVQQDDRGNIWLKPITPWWRSPSPS
jgi:3-phenylpropionate/trans-cinnamate dioxygenase ferredoxin subunit